MAPPDVRVLALRGLGAICCVAECIRQFESVCKYSKGILLYSVKSIINQMMYKLLRQVFTLYYYLQCDGLQAIDDLLCGRYWTVEDRVEAAAVLAQITSPWISDNHKIHNLDLHVMSLVAALTGI